MQDHSNFHFCTIPYEVAKIRSVKQYFNGNSCRNGHLTTRFVSTRGCCQCVKDRYNEWIDSSRNRDKKNSWTARYDEINREEKRSKGRDYVRKNSEKVNKYVKQYRKDNPDWYLSWCREHRKNNRTLYAAKEAKRRTATGAGCDSKEVAAWCDAQEKVCLYCGADCSDAYHIDHFYPISKGGEHEIYNLRISCPTCNLRKSAKLPEVFMEEISNSI